MSKEIILKEDPSTYPPHMQGDIKRKNKNIDEDKVLCSNCSGTGNELYSMYRKCGFCGGTGHKAEECARCGWMKNDAEEWPCIHCNRRHTEDHFKAVFEAPQEDEK